MRNVKTWLGFIACLLVIGACGSFVRHTLTPRAAAVEISKNEPDGCALVGGFNVHRDCITGVVNTPNPSSEEQFECIRWKVDELGGTHAVLDTVDARGFYSGRALRCPTAQ